MLVCEAELLSCAVFPEVTVIPSQLLNHKEDYGYSGVMRIRTERPPLIGEISANFAGRGCRVVSATDPHGR
jgi:hypothetical protein